MKFEIYFEMWNLKCEIWLKPIMKPSLISRSELPVMPYTSSFFTNITKSTFLRSFLRLYNEIDILESIQNSHFSVNFSKPISICSHWFETLLKSISIPSNNV